MEYTNRIFNYVEQNYPDIWKQILAITRLHKISSVKKIFNEHLKHVEDIDIFNKYKKNIAIFILEFCKSNQRNFLTPGESFGSLLTSRTTYVYTQEALDKRHLKDQNSNFQYFNYPMSNDLHFEIHIYTTLNQIFELTNRRRYTTIFVKNYSVEELLHLNPSETCYLKWIQNEAIGLNNQRVCLNLKTYIITESFVPGYLKIIQKSEHKNFIFRHISHKNIVAFTDLKYIYEKCGLVCFTFNLRKIVKLQFFKHMTVENKHELDILNVLIYLYYSGIMLPINRNGLKKNRNRSGLDRCCFEAIKQNLVAESLKETVYKVQSLIEEFFFGQQVSVGTGYKGFALLSKPVQQNMRTESNLHTLEKQNKHFVDDKNNVKTIF